jgi:hypothetical protein
MMASGKLCRICNGVNAAIGPSDVESGYPIYLHIGNFFLYRAILTGFTRTHWRRIVIYAMRVD